jgi:imidazolonepropionase-like amidohydrolase
MRRSTGLVGLIAVMFVCGLIPAESHDLKAGRSAQVVRAFVGASVYAEIGKPLVKNAVIVVKDGRVDGIGPATSVRPPAGAETVNVSGKYIVPGLISAHVHVSDVQGIRPPSYTEANTLRQLGVFARYGITTVLSLGGERDPAFKIRSLQLSPTLDHARIFLSGDVITGRSEEEARQAVARVAALKPDIIKIRIDDNLGTATKLPPEVYRAIIDESHRRSLRVAAHIFYLNDAKEVLKAGADMIAHSVRDQEIDDEFISLMKKRRIPYCPTLTREVSAFAYEATPAFFADPFFLREADPEVVGQLQEPARQEAMRKSPTAQRYKVALEIAKRNLKRASDAGLLVVMGTDSGAFANRFQGFFEHLEMQLMAESGMTPQQILRSATSDAALAVGADAWIGAIKSGYWADLVVLDRDPMVDIRNTRQIASVWVAGNQVRAK